MQLPAPSFYIYYVYKLTLILSQNPQHIALYCIFDQNTKV
jgi:hypothetical protein